VIADTNLAHSLLTERMAAVKTYRVVAKRWAHGWELHIDDVGVTQSRTLGEAEAMVRDYIAADRDADPHSFNVELAVRLGDRLDALRQDAQEASRQAAMAQTQAAEKSRILVRRLKDAGLSGREIATVLDVSPQRVSQLLGALPGESALSRPGSRTTAA
jgi:DNA-directed RNA polymerase specialized sigma subunit